MKKGVVLVTKFLLILLLVVACSKKEAAVQKEIVVDPNVKGGVPEKILFSVKMDEAVALKDIVEGNSDIFLQRVPAATLNGLDEKSKEKLDIYPIPSGSWTFVLNPIPNKAPYQVKVNGATEFNPFAIREVRYALNFLMDRKYIVDEILNGAGGPNFTPTTPGMPNAWKFELQANKMGLTAEGDKEKAIKDISTAIEKAASLPENRNKLVKKDGFWYFEGKPVTLKFVIRVDDPEGRLKLGNYFAALVEQAGIKVEKLLWDRSKAVQAVYNADPAQLGWHLYTEAWGAGSTYVWQDTPIIQHMSSVWGNQPGWGESTWWNFKDEDADKLANKVLEGKVETTDEWWNTLLKLNEYGLNDAVRLFVAYQTDYFVANKERFNERLYYGLGTGLDRAALENANTKDGVLKVLQFSAAGGLYQSAWDPVGARGFNDSYSSNVVQMVFDREIVDGPFGQVDERRASVVSNKSEPVFEKDSKGNVIKVSGKIDVDENAIIVDPKTKKYKKVGKGIKASTETTWKVKFGAWHSGRDIKKSDYLYAEGFVNEWAKEDGAGDKKFDSAYASYWLPNISANVGSRWNADGTVTIWSNYFSPKPGLDAIAETGVPYFRVNGNQKPGYAVPWEVIEAIQAIVVDGSASGTKYGFTEKEGVQPVDLKSESFTKDLRAKLVELASKKAVPEILKGEVTPEEAANDYNLAVKFIDKYGHAVIGYGPYMLTKLDVKTGYAELTAFRDARFTEERGKWAKIYKASRLRIDGVITPDEAYTGEEFKVTINASEVAYPSDEAKKADKGTVEALLINKDGETKIEGKANGDGTFTIILDATKAKAFKGAYTLVVLGTLDGKFTDTKTTSVVFN